MSDRVCIEITLAELLTTPGGLLDDIVNDRCADDDLVNLGDYRIVGHTSNSITVEVACEEGEPEHQCLETVLGDNNIFYCGDCGAELGR